jgi:FMN phosphatase YigB (HAD superfamily)
MDKLILTDVDGVLLNWEYAFNIWMKRHGYTPKEDWQYL